MTSIVKQTTAVMRCRLHIELYLKAPVHIFLYISFMLFTRNSSGDLIANVNFLYFDIVYSLKMQ